MPNDQIQPDAPLTAFTVPLEMLEDVAGVRTLCANSVLFSKAGSDMLLLHGSGACSVVLLSRQDRS